MAQLLAAVLACSIFALVSNWGPLMPLTSVKQLNLTYSEASMMWLTGSPPKRFQHSGKENITDVLEDIEVFHAAQEGGFGKLSRRAREAGAALLKSAGSKNLQDAPQPRDQAAGV